MVSCELVTGLIRTPLVIAYLPLSMIKYLLELEEALKRFKDPILLGELNVDLNWTRKPWIWQVADPLTKYGLIDLVRHFCQQRRFRNLTTWSQVRQGTVL